jgi:uncharacterized Zn finger protein
VTENAHAKGRRYASEGRLTIRELDEHAGIVMGDCRGDGATYVVGRDESGWFCSCPARGRCAHMIAVGLVVAVEPREAS